MSGLKREIGSSNTVYRLKSYSCEWASGQGVFFSTGQWDDFCGDYLGSNLHIVLNRYPSGSREVQA
jgi:hypothetical protein